MNLITSLKSYNALQLVNLLRDCAHDLAMAYEEIQVKTLLVTSQHALQASEYLWCLLQTEKSNQTVH